MDSTCCWKLGAAGGAPLAQAAAVEVVFSVACAFLTSATTWRTCGCIPYEISGEQPVLVHVQDGASAPALQKMRTRTVVPWR